MKYLSLAVFLLFCCDQKKIYNDAIPVSSVPTDRISELMYPAGSWQDFLQHLPVKQGPILDYTGHQISNQAKHSAIINYDVGDRDLQQCADALIRMRTEYLFESKNYSAIGFHFTGGGYYKWTDYCNGIRPLIKNNHIQFLKIGNNAAEASHTDLRKYLDIVYDFANTVSLSAELIPANKLETGTVIIYPGYPGHCCMIINTGIKAPKDTVYTLAEGYMPAQSIYILANPYEPGISPWYHLQKGIISTATTEFRSYYLRKFE